MDFEKWLKLPFDPQSGFKGLDERIPAETRVVLGMTGGVDSIAAAFLLKKRGFQCIAVGIYFLDEEQVKQNMFRKRKTGEKDYSKLTYNKHKARNKGKDEEIKFLTGNCSVKQMDNVKKICEQLDIPFFGVNACIEFNDLILDPLVASKLSGEVFFPCVSCNNLKFDILLRKAQMLNADFVASGHYAKVHKSEKGNVFHLFNSNDEENDQSFLLSKLTQVHLARVIFPLAEIRKNEVVKIIERFKLNPVHSRDCRKLCFISQGNLTQFTESRAFMKLMPTGGFYEKKSGLQMGDHPGIHHFRIGEKDVEDRQTKISLITIDPTMNVISIDSLGKIFLGHDDEFYFGGCGVGDLNLGPQFEQCRPQEVYVQFHLNGKKVRSTLYFKNNLHGLLDFSMRVYGLGKGQHLTFFNHDGVGGKVLGSGTITYLGEISVINRTKRLDTVLTDELGNVVERKINPLRF